jgi:hypothetical protein
MKISKGGAKDSRFSTEDPVVMSGTASSHVGISKYLYNTLGSSIFDKTSPEEILNSQLVLVIGRYWTGESATNNKQQKGCIVTGADTR